VAASALDQLSLGGYILIGRKKFRLRVWQNQANPL